MAIACLPFDYLVVSSLLLACFVQAFLNCFSLLPRTAVQLLVVADAGRLLSQDKLRLGIPASVPLGISCLSVSPCSRGDMEEGDRAQWGP